MRRPRVMNQNGASVTTAGWAELDRSASEGQELVGPASHGEELDFPSQGDRKPPRRAQRHRAHQRGLEGAVRSRRSSAGIPGGGPGGLRLLASVSSSAKQKGHRRRSRFAEQGRFANGGGELQAIPVSAGSVWRSGRTHLFLNSDSKSAKSWVFHT